MSTLQHSLRLDAQARGDRVVIGKRKLIQKRVRAQRVDARTAPEDSSDGFLSLHTCIPLYLFRV